MGSPCSPVVANIYMEYFEKTALGPELPVSFTINTWLRYVDDVLTIVKKGTHDSLLNYLNSIDPNIKFTIEPPNEQGAIPFLDTFPRPSGNKIITSVYRKPTHTDRYLDFNSNHPKSAKRAVVRALTNRAKNVCSSPELLAEEMDHLGKVLKYNNYPKWMIDQHGRNSSERRLIDPETGNEVKKSVFISAPYFPGLSESFKQLEALSNKSPALQSPIARMLNTYTPTGVSIAVSNLDLALNGKWKTPFVASNTLKYLASFNW